MSQSIPFVTDSATQAANWLKEGKLLAYPTESVWGIGCDPYNQAAVQRILDIKQRPQAKGMIVITDSVERLSPLLASLNNAQRQQIIDSWQSDVNDSELHNRQAHTWLLPIAHPIIRKLCQQMVSENNPFGFIVSTSCNPSGQSPASTFDTAYGYFGEQIGYFQADTLGYILPSQIRDATTGSVIR